jgi:hypothetical protein
MTLRRQIVDCHGFTELHIAGWRICAGREIANFASKHELSVKGTTLTRVILWSMRNPSSDSHSVNFALAIANF